VTRSDFARTFGKASELLGVTKWEFTDLLNEKDVPLSYDEDDLEEDLRTLLMN